MSSRGHVASLVAQLGAILKWFAIVVPMASIVGGACAGFLWSLDRATQLRFDHPWLVFGLPVAGMAIGFVYFWTGRSTEGGNNLIVDQIHEPGAGVPLRMAPLIVVSTVVTHLFGGSAGREGTAVQLGGSVASGVAKACGLDATDVRIVLMAGIAAGFGAVFGTPIAGAIFALEVLSVGRIQYEAIIPCLIAAITGDWVCHACGIEHTQYHIAFQSGLGAPASGFPIDGLLLAKVAVAGMAFGLTGLLFSEASHSAGALFKKLCPLAPLRPAIGGLLIIALIYAFGTREYLGLGVWSPNPGDVTIQSLFHGDRIVYWSWLWKILFTVVTLSTGFKGGEVTPLFFIGAALGNALSGALGAPTDLFAGLGFVAIFAAASNTPLACTIMGIELFGATHMVYIAVACFMAYAFSGHSGIYLSQRIAIPKTMTGLIPPDISLRHARAYRPEPLHTIFDRFADKKVGSAQPLRHSQQEIDGMSYPHRVSSQETGMLRIYLKPGERTKKTGLRSILSSRPLYRELVLAAKTFGIVNAVAHHTHYGYSNNSKVQAPMAEIGNPDLAICVELIGERVHLETFCRQQGELLENRVIVYKSLERWHIDAVSRAESTEVAEKDVA